MFGKKRRKQPEDALVRKLMDIVGEDEVLYLREDLVAYECDGFTMTTGIPRAVVFVHNTEEVSQIVRPLNKENVPYIARGAGTGLSGGATPFGGEVIISMPVGARPVSVVGRVGRGSTEPVESGLP